MDELNKLLDGLRSRQRLMAQNERDGYDSDFNSLDMGDLIEEIERAANYLSGEAYNKGYADATAAMEQFV